MDDFIKCEECKYKDDCPAGFSYCNSACLIIQTACSDCGKEMESYSEEVKEYVTNCPNCGAPMTNHKCAYCGTEDYGRR